MNNLRNFCLRVSNDYERKVAVAFFKRAMHIPLRHYNRLGEYVGLINKHPFADDAKDSRRGVICGNVACPNETIIPFQNIAQLADSPNRVKALKSARASAVTRLTIHKPLIN